MSWLWKKLGAVPPDEMGGLQLHFAGCWAIRSPRWDGPLGFTALSIFAAKDTFLYLEGGAHAGEVKAFLDAHAIAPVQRIARGTIWPRQGIFHLRGTQRVLVGLSRLADHHAIPEICDHLVLYRPTLVLVDWYDAFDREIYASSTIPQQFIEEFTAKVCGSYRIESY